MQFRQDMILQVGTLNETVQVTSQAGLSVTQPDVSHTVDEKYYRDLPIITAGGRAPRRVRAADATRLPSHGPNGDPMFRGSQFNSRINGGQTMATENSSTAPRSATRSGTSRARRAHRRWRPSRR